MDLKTLGSQFMAVWKQGRWRWAMAAALVSDVISFGLEVVSLGLAEPIQIGVDLLTAAVLLALLGFRWTLAIPLAAEAIPGVAAFPTWTLFVAAYAALEKPAVEDPGHITGSGI